ncbi:MAG TPA: cyclopropane fatty acyl phospholipid synthase [Chloroflexota bacterium]|jgi:cyclopropane-fatty-acyl-phospholipid synthase
MQPCEARARALLAEADVEINGDRPWDIQVHDGRFYGRVFRDGDLGFGESYMDGWWDSAQLEETFYRIFRADLGARVRGSLAYRLWIGLHRLINFASKQRAFMVGQVHYDVGNDLYRLMLDPRLTYTCAYWRDATTLDAAQEAKLDLVCRKLRLAPGHTVLDIGCGWGSFACFAAERYGAQVVGSTVSTEQAKLAEQRCKGLPVCILLQDYRNLQGRFDRVVSLGMFEHVGYKNYRTYMRIVDQCLVDDGLFLLGCGGTNRTEYTSGAWTHKYIFPNSHLPSAPQIARATEGLFVIEDWHVMSLDYYRTIIAWFENFDRHWPALADRYGARFYRMWKFYLLACAAADRSRSAHNWQIVLSKGCLAGYQSAR